jgi:hypothetical protein
LLIVDSGAPEKESIVTSRGGVVAAFRGGAVARSMGIWEREKDKRKSGSRAGEKGRSGSPVHVHGDGEKL